eukprot:6181512-Pleurochrysis_carterae.AAC.2
MTKEKCATAEEPIHIVILFDAFPVENISITHYCVANASLRPQLSDQPEQLLRGLCAAPVSESNAQLRRATTHNGLGAGFNQLARTELIKVADAAGGTSSRHVRPFLCATRRGSRPFAAARKAAFGATVTTHSASRFLGSLTSPPEPGVRQRPSC